MPIDPRTLSSFRNAQIEGDVACVKCGYNLKGLSRGGNCPECGAPIASSLARGRFLFKNLTDAPMGYLKLLRMGFFLIAACVAGLLASIILAVRLGGLGASLLVAGLSVLWWGGVYLVTSSEHPPGELHNKYDRLRWLRWANRLLQASWAVAWSLAVVQALLIARQNALIATGALTPALTTSLDFWIAVSGTACMVMQLIGLASLVPLCIHFAEIATAAGNDSLATRLGLSAWGIILFGGYLTLAIIFARTGGFGSLLVFGTGLAGLGMIAVVGLFIWCLIELASMCGWAVANSYAAIARDQRLLERAQREEAAVQARLAELPPLDMYHKPRTRRGQAPGDAPIPLEPER